MFTPPRDSTKNVAIRTTLVLIQACCHLSAQNFTVRAANLNPFGVNGPLPFGRALDSEGGIGFKGGLAYGIGVDSTYDSNFFMTEKDSESEFSMSLSPAITYSSDPEGGAKMAISANYLPSAHAYLNNPDLNGVDHSGSVSMIISGSRTTISAFAGYSQDSGTDRLAGGFFTGSSLSLGLQGSYQLAPRTSVVAGWSSSVSDYGDGSAVGFNGYSVNVGGFWAATERFSFGPSLSYSVSSSDNTGDRDSWGFSLQANYQAGEKIRLAASLGTQYSENSREDDTGGFNLTGSLNASYQINELWAWSNSIQSGVVPSPTQTNYVINNWSVTSSLSRQLLIGSVGFGLDMIFSNFDSVGVTEESQDGEQNIGLLLSYSRPLFRDRVGFSSSVRYGLNTGDQEWSQIQVNAGLNMAF